MVNTYKVRVALQPQGVGIRRYITTEVSGEHEDEATFNTIAFLNPVIKEDVDIIIQSITLIK